MNKLIHPATAFIQALPYTEVAFKDMTPLQQQAVWEFMYYFGDGIWGESVNSIAEAREKFGDFKLGVGTFANDITMKQAIAATYPGEDEEWPSVEVWFKNRFACEYTSDPQPPVILDSPALAPEFGLIQWGHEGFYSYWLHLDRTEFLRFIPNPQPE